MLLQYLPFLALIGTTSALTHNCKCTPQNPCWPTLNTWTTLNTSISGKLIQNLPPAISCYPGPYKNDAECAYVYSQWYNSTFQSLEPVGYIYPTHDSCLPVDLESGEIPGSCELGTAPVYTINATRPEELARGIAFAREWNVRLVVRNTGHDLLGKSAGYGALQIWIKYIKQGITFHERYSASDQCKKSKWEGFAFTIAGGYIWEDVYREAFKRNLIIVGGGDPNVGCIGGYTQGGGHSPACRDYGLAADQVLEAQVVLANGSIVTANACQNQDLYFAIRGGGGGTYGVVTSITIKAYPSKPVVAQSLIIQPLGNNTRALLDAVTDVYTEHPALSDAGFSGYGTWSINSPAALFANETVGYVHAIAAMNRSFEEAQSAFAPLLSKLHQYNGTSLSVIVTWLQFPTYEAYYRTMSDKNYPGSSANAALTSRMFDKDALTRNKSRLRHMIDVIAGTPEQHTINSVLYVGGGKVLTDGKDRLSGVNPAWRSTYLVNIASRGWAEGADEATAQAIKDDITYTKNGAMRLLTPTLGSYMNEADRNSPLWESDFYGAHYAPLTRIKEKYDPEGILYCPKCVGSSSWYERYLPGKDYGPLCSS